MLLLLLLLHVLLGNCYFFRIDALAYATTFTFAYAAVVAVVVFYYFINNSASVGLRCSALFCSLTFAAAVMAVAAGDVADFIIAGADDRYV